MHVASAVIAINIGRETRGFPEVEELVWNSRNILAQLTCAGQDSIPEDSVWTLGGDSYWIKGFRPSFFL